MFEIAYAVISHHCTSIPYLKEPVSDLLFFPSDLFSTRRMVSRIDQSEFEGFEYVNPLLMSGEECV